MPIGIIILFRMSFVDPPPPNLTNALPLVYISFIWVNEDLLYQILSSQYYEQIYLKMTFSHVFFFKKRNGYGTERKRQISLRICWVTKKFRKVVAKKYVSKTII